VPRGRELRAQNDSQIPLCTLGLCFCSTFSLTECCELDLYQPAIGPASYPEREVGAAARQTGAATIKASDCGAWVKVFQQGERTISAGRAAPLILSRMRRQRLLRNRLLVERRSVRSKSVRAAGFSCLQAHIEELPRISQVTTVTLAAQR